MNNLLFLIRNGYKKIGSYRGKTVRVWDKVLRTKLYKKAMKSFKKPKRKLHCGHCKVLVDIDEFNFNEGLCDDCLEDWEKDMSV